MIIIIKSKFSILEGYAVIWSKENTEIIVDIDMVEKLAKHRWYIKPNGEPCANIKYNKVAYRVTMKSLIMNKEFGDKKIIYYKNENPLDNRLKNLTYCKNEIIIVNDHAIVKTTKDTKVDCNIKIDIDMIDLVSQYTWTYKVGGYLFRSEGRKMRYLHNMIMGVDDYDTEYYVDHINRDPSDNRRNNLRICTHVQNQYNKGKYNLKYATSKYKGVDWVKRKNMWRVRISYNGTEETIGYFFDEVAAANAYNHASIKYHGEFGNLNEVPYMAPEEVKESMYKRKNRSHTKYTGISYHIHTKKWVARFRWNGDDIHIGYYNSEIEAAKAYNEKVLDMKIERKLNII